VNWWLRGRNRLFRAHGGFILIEVLVAVGILGLIGMSILAAMDTNYRATRTLDERVVAASLASTHLEAIRGAVYADNYTAAVDNITIPAEYDVAIEVEYSDNGTAWVDTYSGQKLERITASVSKGEEYVLSICTYKTKR
jgi:type II secretory pathway pseudopilin PulG